MKLFASLLVTSFVFTAPTWKTDFNDAKTEATKNNKCILVSFSGSDWCLPCIQLKKKIFESESFLTYAADNLVLVNADFPRQNKHKLNPQQKKQNEALAGMYDPEGKFPFTVLMDPNGKTLKQWDGLPDVAADDFVNQVKEAVKQSH